MKKHIILLILLLLTGCDVTNKNEIDNAAPVVTILEQPTIYTTTAFTIENYISVTDDNDFVINWNADDLIDREGICDIEFTVVDSFNNSSIGRLTVTVLEGISDYKSLELIDYTSYANVGGKTINLKQNIDDPEISYVSLNEFVKKVRIDDIFTSIQEEESSVVDFQIIDIKTFGSMEFNARENTVYMSNRDVLDNEFFRSGNLLDEDNEKNSTLLIDLNKYNMRLVKQGGEIYLPLYLASFLLTGRIVDLYELDNQVLLFDFPFLSDDAGDAIANGERSQNFETSIRHTYDYLALWIDVKYGLSEYKGISDSYLLLEQYPDLLSPESVTKYYSSLSRFIGDLDDLHTSLHSAGTRLPTYRSPTLSRLYRTPARYDYLCQFGGKKFDFKVVDGVAFVKVNAFDSGYENEFLELMEQASEYETIVIDLSCNTGGNLSVSMDYLSYLANHNFYRNQVDTLTGRRYKDIEGTKNFVEAEYYLFTSSITYSAASLFTQVAKDNDFATVVGDITGGGSCSVSWMVTPDGALVGYSSSSAQVDSEFGIFDDGVTPDYYLDEKDQGNTWEEVIVGFIKSIRY